MQVLLNGTISGLNLAVIALGFSLVYLPTRTFHIAMAGVYTLVPYLFLTLVNRGAAWWLAGHLSLVAAVLVSVLCELGNHRWLERKHASHGAHIVSSLGIYIVIVQIVALVWGNETQILRTGIDKTFHLGSVILTYTQLAAGAVSLLLVIALYCWLRFSGLGLRFRALADNPTEFALRGYNVDGYRLLAFGTSGLLAGVAALLTAYDVGTDPYGGLHVVLLGVVAVIIGGRQSFLGPALGGLLLGIIRSQAVWHFSARWQDVICFLILVLFLYGRPNGICGAATRLEAEE
jgi:branched-chain amino acid transport system permease protein